MSDQSSPFGPETPPPSDPGPKSAPEDLTLRARPQSVTRLNRKVLLAIAIAASFAIFGATMFALDPPRFGGRDDGGELYNVDNKAIAEGLDGLPRSYKDIPPKLGAPLPGDLGGTILETERDLGIAQLPPGNTGFQPDPYEDALRAERLRLKRKEEQARESQVFFQVAARPPGTSLNLSPQAQLAGDQFSPATPESSERSSLGLDRANDQNLQGRKLGFLNQKSDPNIYSAHALQDPASPYQVMAGTILSASLITGINSDLPGQVIAQVTENVYDTVTGRYLLIPQGARLLGKYDSVIAFGQERALVVWNRIINPDGSSIVIDNLSATDTAGYAGLEDEVDFHTWQLIKGIVLSTLLGVGTELTFSDNESDLVTAFRESAQGSANQAGQRITERNLNIQPTITIRPGWPLRVIVNKDIILRPYRG